MKNKVALITGASRGIGLAVARAFAQKGIITAINYFKSESAAKNAEAELLKDGFNAKAYRADVSDLDQVSDMVFKITKDFGGIDILVNNAGVANTGLFHLLSGKDMRRIIDINLLGALYCAKAVLPGMINKKSGNIINISSMWGEVGASCETVYSASKAGLIGFTKALAKELGPSGIRVNCISPGFIDTQMNDCISAEDKKAFISDIPFKRAGTPQDIAKTALFLVSDSSSYITGEIIGVNGGLIV